MTENADNSSASPSLEAISGSKSEIPPITANLVEPDPSEDSLKASPNKELELSILKRLREEAEAQQQTLNSLGAMEQNFAREMLIGLAPALDFKSSISQQTGNFNAMSLGLSSIFKDFQNSQSLIQNQLMPGLEALKSIDPSITGLVKTIDLNGLTSITNLMASQYEGIGYLSSIAKQALDNQNDFLSNLVTPLVEQQHFMSDLVKQAQDSLSWMAQIQMPGQAALEFVLDPLWEDIKQAENGNSVAAGRIAARIHWYPDQVQREAIRRQARITDSSIEEIRNEALTRGVLSALNWKKEDRIPILIQPQSTWLYNPDHSLETICPYEEMPTRFFWKWVREESVRAAGLWLIKHPYAITVVVAEPPVDSKPLQLYRFTSNPEDQHKFLKGRPFGSGIFENKEVFLSEIRSAIAKIRERDNKVTQEGVAEVLSQKGLVGMAQPVSQLRR